MKSKVGTSRRPSFWFAFGGASNANNHFLGACHGAILSSLVPFSQGEPRSSVARKTLKSWRREKMPLRAGVVSRNIQRKPSSIQVNTTSVFWKFFIPCCVFDVMDYYEALFQSALLSLEVGLEQVCSHLLVPSNLQMKKNPFLESGLATDLSREQRRACDGDSRPGNFDFKCGLNFLEAAQKIEPLLLQ